jgi:hypothetical protein
MTHDEAKIEFLGLLEKYWPIDITSKSPGRRGVEAMRKALVPYCALKHVPENELPKIVKRFQVMSENARIRYVKPDPDGTASLMLS